MPNGRLTYHPITLELQNPFRVSYGVSQTRQAFWLRLADDAGWGEASIPPYYDVSDASMIAYWQTITQRTDPFPDDPADIVAWVGHDGPAPARCALDLALHDRIGRLRGVPLYKLLNLPAPKPLATAYTISLDTPEVMAQQAAQLPNYPIIKLKLGGDADIACVTAVRAARPDVELCVDVNGGWSVDEAVSKACALLPYKLSFIEQPVPKGEIAAMGEVQAAINIPVVADESVQTVADVKQLAAAGVQAINVKLMKLGGLAPTIRFIEQAQSLGLRIMLGCMVETSLGVTAMAHLAGFAHWLDLDAPLLITNDPFNGLTYDVNAYLQLPDRPGIGVVRNQVIGQSHPCNYAN